MPQKRTKPQKKPYTVTAKVRTVRSKPYTVTATVKDVRSKPGFIKAR